MSSVIRWTVVAVVVIHGLIHILGAAKAFGWFEVPQLKGAISPVAGVVWLVSAAMLLVTALMIARNSPTWWWAVAGVAVVLSQAMIVTAWSDAKAGTVANVIIVIAVIYGFASLGPGSFASEWHEDAAEALRQTPAAAGDVTETDLADLPAPLARYLRRSGVVGKPRVTNFYAEVHGRIRNQQKDPWMSFEGKQFNTYGSHTQRLFFITATRAGLPAEILHVYRDSTATMRGKLLSVLPIVDVSGPDMNHSETVTVFNDLVLFAPGALIGAPVRWTAVDDHRVRGIYTNGPESVTAELTFDDDGDLVDFSSEDRSRASADGKTLTPLRWHTPVTEYRDFDGRRVVAGGDGKWFAPEPDGHYTYIEFHIDRIVYNADAPTVG